MFIHTDRQSRATNEGSAAANKPMTMVMSSVFVLLVIDLEWILCFIIIDERKMLKQGY